MKMQKKLKTFAFLFFFLLVSGLAFSEDCDTLGEYQFRESGCETECRKCCPNGWSAWTTGITCQCPPPRPPSTPCSDAEKASCSQDPGNILISCDIECVCDRTSNTYTSCTITPECADGYKAVSTTIEPSMLQNGETGWRPLNFSNLCSKINKPTDPPSSKTYYWQWDTDAPCNNRGVSSINRCTCNEQMEGAYCYVIDEEAETDGTGVSCDIYVCKYGYN